MLQRICPRNESTVDRGLRVVLGLVMLSLTFWGPSTPWGLLGFIPLVTGVVGSCPIYTLLGVGTRGTTSTTVPQS